MLPKSAKYTLVTVLPYQTIATTTATEWKFSLQYLVSHVVRFVPTHSNTQLIQSVCTTIITAVFS